MSRWPPQSTYQWKLSFSRSHGQVEPSGVGWSWFCACPVRAEGAIRLRLRTWLTWCLRLCGRGPGAASSGAMVIRCQVRVGNLPGHFCPTPIPAFKRSRTRLPSTLGLTRVLFLGPLCSRSPSRGQIRSLNLVFWWRRPEPAPSRPLPLVLWFNLIKNSCDFCFICAFTKPWLFATSGYFVENNLHLVSGGLSYLVGSLRYQANCIDLF